MKILIPIDGSEHSKKALEKAKTLGAALKADITILNVLNPSVDLRTMQNRTFYDEINKNSKLRAQEIIDDGMKLLSDYPGKVESVSKVGDAVSEIISFAEDGNFDLVIMGSRGAGLFSRTLLGSVSDKVIHHIKTSVLIVK